MQDSSAIKPITFLLSAILATYGLWSWFFQAGLYAFLIRLLVNNADIYYPLITGLVMCALLAIIPLVFNFSNNKRRHEYQLRYEELKSKLRKSTVWLALITMIFISLTAAAYTLSNNVVGKNQQTLKIDLANYQAQSLWLKKVSLNGVALTDSATVTTESDQDGNEVYVRYTPIVTSKRSKEPIRFVEALRADTTSQVAKQNVSLTGFVKPSALPVLIKDSLKKDGLVLAKRTYLISAQAFNAQSFFYTATIILGLISLLLIAWLVTVLFRNRTKLRECKEHQGNW